MVSFDDIMDAVDRAADALEVSGISRVSDPRTRKRRKRHSIVVEISRRQMISMFSESSSAIEYSSYSQVSFTIDSPTGEASSKCNTSLIQGRQEVVIIHVSSDSEEDVEID